MRSQKINRNHIIKIIQKEKRMEKFALTVMVAVSLMASGCGQEQKPEATKSGSVESQAQGLVQQVQAVSQEAKQEVAPAIEQAKADLGGAANAMVDQAKDLLAKAQEMVNNGKFNEAINFAQQVLSIDPNNIDAKNIIETAKTKLAQMAQDKAGELKTGLTNALGN